MADGQPMESQAPSQSQARSGAAVLDSSFQNISSIDELLQRIDAELAAAEDAQELLDARDGELSVRIELGGSVMSAGEISELGEGSVVPLNRASGDPVDLFVENKLVARGEIVVVDGNFSVRVTQVLDDAKVEAM